MSRHNKRSNKKLSMAMPNAKRQAAPRAYSGYLDLAFDEPKLTSAQTMVLADSYTPDIGHQRRVALMIERHLALQNARISTQEACTDK
jgi:hypothetical protein